MVSIAEDSLLKEPSDIAAASSMPTQEDVVFDTAIQQFHGLITKIELASATGPAYSTEQGGTANTDRESPGKSQILYQCLVCAEIFHDLATILHDHIQEHRPEDISVAQCSVYSEDEEAYIPSNAETMRVGTLYEKDNMSDSDEGNSGVKGTIATYQNQGPVPYSENASTRSGTSDNVNESKNNHVLDNVVYASKNASMHRFSSRMARHMQGNPDETRRADAVEEPMSSGSTSTKQLPAISVDVLTSIANKQLCFVCGKDRSKYTSLTTQPGVYDEYGCGSCSQSSDANKSPTAPGRPHSKKLDHTRCAICTKVFASSKTLRKHVKAVHKSSIPYGCKLCDKSFLNRRALRSHREDHHPDNANANKCEVCRKSFSNMGEKHEHEKRHKSEVHHCKECKGTFRKKKDLLAHRRDVHIVERPYQCEICSKSYTDDKFLRLHMVSKHTNPEYLYPCETCQAQFQTQSELRDHDLAVHGPKPKEYRLCCRYCDLIFDALVLLLRHEEGHRRKQDTPVRFLSSDEKNA